MNVIKLPAAGISGHITLHRRSAVDPSGDVTVGPVCNLITDRMLASRLGDFVPTVSLREALAYCRVGTDGTPPLPSDTALIAQIASTNNVVAGPTAVANYDDTGRGYVSLFTTYSFGLGAAAGTLEEVGFGSTAAADVLLSRALIKNLAGVPTPLVVAPTDYLDVVYELRLYTIADTSDTVLPAVVIDGSPYDITIRPVGAASFEDLVTSNPGDPWTSFNTKEIRHLHPLGLPERWLCAFAAGDVMPATEDPWGLGTGGASIDANTVLAPYVPNSKQRTITANILPSDFNLVGGISYLRAATSEGGWGISFDPPLPKTAADTVVIDMLVQALQRYTP